MSKDLYRQAIALPIPRGGVLAMKPLLVHASPRTKTSDRRRVIHIEFAAAQLPKGLQWCCFAIDSTER